MACLIAAIFTCKLSAQIEDRLELRHLSTYHTGIFGSGAAEISAYNVASKRLFFVNATNNSLEVLNVANPAQPEWLFEIFMDQYGGGINSVVTWDGFVAVALEAPVKQDPGTVAIFNTQGEWITQVEVGVLPDMIAIDPAHTLLITANEGEPNDSYTVDPEGSISIIQLEGGVEALTQTQVTTLGFQAFNYYRSSFEASNEWPFFALPEAFDTAESSWGPALQGNGRNAPQGSQFWKGTDVNTTGSEWNNVFTLSSEPYYLENLPQRHIEFFCYAENWSTEDSFGYIVQYDDGSSWDESLEVNIVPTASWTKVRIPIDADAGVVRIQLRIQRTVQAGDVGIDDVRISYLDEQTRVFGRNGLQTVAQDLEPEYVTFSADGTKAWVSLQENNAMVEVDIQSQQVVQIKGLGYKDWSQSAVDASDQDGQIRIVPQPVYGMYQPDAISSVLIDGEQFILSANEGDARAYGGFNEEVRLSSRILDAAAFPNGTALKSNSNAGRLRVSSVMGDVDFDGDYDEVYAYGARSFSIWNASSELVFDSGDDFEQQVALVNPGQFNANNDDNTSFDSRSDDKGPEPEAITSGWIEGRLYAFVGLERVGGIMVYDITEPQSPLFVQYINNRNFSVVEGLPGAGDLGPEGILFIPKSESPNERNLIVLSSEISGTVSIFQVDINRTADGEIVLESATWTDPQQVASFNGLPIFQGGFSGLYPVPGTNNEFYTITDRGPNADASAHPLASGNTVFFPQPSYSPSIVRMLKTPTEWVFVSAMPIRQPNGEPVSGIPLPLNAGGTGEVAWSTLNGNVIEPDAWGIDAEGIAFGNDGYFWVCDEYGASIWKIDPESGEVVKRYTPFPAELIDVELDSAISYRRPNRGFEGITWSPNGKVYAILQSPAGFPDLAGTVESRIHRLVELDPWTEEMRYYTIAHKAAIGEIREQDWKFSDLAAINNHQFLAIEHAQRNGWNYKNIIKIDIQSASPLTEQTFGGLSVEELGSEENLANAGITSAQRTLFLDLLEAGWNTEFDKPEGLAILNDSTIAVCNDNDFGIDSPGNNGSLVATNQASQIWMYTLPQPLHLEYVSPFCELVIDAPSSACANELVTLSITQPAQQVEWTTGETEVTIETTESFIGVRAITASGCVATAEQTIVRAELPMILWSPQERYCTSDTVLIELNQQLSYTWTAGEYGDSLVLPLAGFEEGEVTLGVSLFSPETGCSAEQVFSFFVEQNPISSLLNEYTACEGEEVVLQVVTNNNEALWSTGEVGAEVTVQSNAEMWVELTSSFGCVTRDSLNVTFFPIPMDVLPLDTLLCHNQTWTIDLSQFSTANWSDGSTDLLRILSAPNALSVTLTNENNCSQTESIALLVSPIEPVQLGEDFVLCFGSDSLLVLENFDSYLWSDGSVFSSLLVNQPASISVAVTDEFGCVSSDAIEVGVYDELVIGLPDTLVFCAGESVLLVPGNFDSYLWSTGSTNPELVVNEPGVYQVTVQSNGCFSSRNVVVEEVICIQVEEVNEQARILLFPNPVSDVLHVECADPITLLRVYDQKGALVYEVAERDFSGHISVANWTAGMYCIHAVTEGNFILQTRIAKL